MKINKLYSILLIATIAGYSYLFYKINHSESSHLSVCIIKNVTGYACPSCGTTRAVQLLLQGKLLESLLLNPFGIIVAILMLLVPFWITFDIITKKETFFNFYKKTETVIRKKPIAIVLIILVLLNWIWNIYKQL
ncbi:DUF2752 domain-containing protein [Flavobacterium sp.]|uniref:DUF2752 domain-containing protein n=1 Tax=Flavobacterium sp. TaxID=239 RepID=UPI003752F548